MRTAYLIIGGLLLAASSSYAQGVGIGTPTPASTAVLDVSSTTKGLLLPRLTAAQRTAISAPANGLLVYQTDGLAGLYQFQSTAWVALGNNSAGSTTSIAAPTTATTLNPTTTTVIYTDNNNTTNGAVTLGTGLEGQVVVIVNNDTQYLPVVSNSGTGNLLPKYAARFVYAGGLWRRES